MSEQALDFDAQHASLLQSVLDGSPQLNERTGHNIMTVLHRSVTVFHDRSRGWPLPNLRRTWLKSASAEVAWQILGSKSIGWLTTKTPMWDKFANANGDVETAYGDRWRYHFARDQLAMLINALTNDPSNRQLVVSAWDPSVDGLGDMRSSKSNVPCPVVFSVQALLKEVHLHVFVRSSDVVVGLPYDYLSYALLLSAIAKSVNLEPGGVTLSLSHAHIYDTQMPLAMAMLYRWEHSGRRTARHFAPPSMSVQDITDHPDMYVSKAMEESRCAGMPPSQLVVVADVIT